MNVRTNDAELSRGTKSALLESMDVQWHVQSDKIAFRFLGKNGEETESLTYRQLSRRVFALAHALVAQGCGGQPVLLLYPDGLDFVVGMLASLYAGAFAVPLPLPRDLNTAQRIGLCSIDCRARVILTSMAAVAPLKAGLNGLLSESLVWMTEDDCANTEPGGPPDVAIDDRTAGLLQYTSGSTGTPKGVVITHGNLDANASVIRTAFAHDASLVGVGWLPLSHDMGLMGHVFQPLLVGGESNLMSPATFIRQPRRWLEAISKYRARTSGGPCFAFELACRRISPHDLGDLDLSSWSLAYCGAEPVRLESLETFARHFAPAGFAARAFYPCYGLAESTLFVSGGQSGGGVTAEGVCGDALTTGHVVRDPAGPRTRTVVNCGHPWLGHEVVVVDPDTQEACRPDTTGELWVRGPSVASGYWNREDESRATFRATIRGDESRATYLRTGDLGYVANGNVYVTGRSKDVLIVNGKNRHAEDIEATARGADALLFSRRSAAFATHASGSELAVLVQEVNEPFAAEAPAQLGKQIQASLFSAHGFVADEIVFVPNGAIPRTTSGKVRRRDCRRLYETRALPTLGHFRSASTG